MSLAMVFLNLRRKGRFSMERIYRWVAGGHVIIDTVSRFWAKWICTELQRVQCLFSKPGCLTT